MADDFCGCRQHNPVVRRPTRRPRRPSAAFWGALVLLGALLGLSGCRSGAGPVEYQLAIRPDEQDPTRVVVRLSSDPPEAIRSLERRGAERSRMEAALFLTLDGPPEEFVPILGEYSVVGDAVEFRPQASLSRGQAYLAVFNPAAAQLAGTQITAPYSPPTAAANTVVSAVYPQAKVLPENLLRLYLHFSAPMGEGTVFEHLRLLDAEGRPIPDAFRETELWSSDHRRLTVLLHPGRIKRGLALHEQAGPVLRAGERYTLGVDSGLRDAKEAPLKQAFRLNFTAGAAQRGRPRIAEWELKPPGAQSREPLRVTFPEMLDHALLKRLLWVERPSGERVAGEITVNDAGSEWRFTPAKPWVAETHQLVADVELEDVAGNNLDRAFEVPEGSQPFAPPAARTQSRPWAPSER